jgi:hypothetical protein
MEKSSSPEPDNDNKKMLDKVMKTLKNYEA